MGHEWIRKEPIAELLGGRLTNPRGDATTGFHDARFMGAPGPVTSELNLTIE